MKARGNALGTWFHTQRPAPKWIKTKGAGYARFSWQNRYGAFSIGQSQLAAAKRYVAQPKEHHKQKTFQEELREFLRKYQVDYDERYAISLQD